MTEDLDCIKPQVEVTAIGMVKPPFQRYPFFLFPCTKTLHVVGLEEACTADMQHDEANMPKHETCGLCCSKMEADDRAGAVAGDKV